MFGIRTKISLLRTKMRWRGINGDNGTYPVSPIADLSNIEIGRYSYGPIDVHTSSIAPCLTIGSFCSIASDVVFVTHDEHPTDRFSTFPFKVMVLGEEGPEATSKGGIVLEDDVWVGYRATILDGVTIHRGGLSPQVPSFARTCRRIPSSEVSQRSQSSRDSTMRRSRASWSSTIPRSTGCGFKSVYNSSTPRSTSASCGSF